MNKNLLLFTIFFLSGLMSFAQKGWEASVYYLPENTAIGTGVKDPHEKNKLTFAGGAGLSFTYNFTDKIGLQFGALYTSHNQKWKSVVNGGTPYEFTWKGKKRLDYFNIPVLLRYRYRISPRIKSVFYGGAEGSYLIKAAGGLVVYQQASPGGSDFYDLPNASNSYYNKFIVQAVAGWGLDFKISRRLTLNTAVRIEYALTDGANKKSTYLDLPYYSFNGKDSFSSRNHAIGLLMGVSYKFMNSTDLVAPSSKW